MKLAQYNKTLKNH